MDLLKTLTSDRPVLIAGPTASGKSALALALAERDGRPVLNADAMQVFANWRVLTARPSREDEARAPHHLYGHVPGDEDYSVGAWLRDIRRYLQLSAPPVIVGGTGLYFSALTEGLADIPAIPAEIHQQAAARLQQQGLQVMLDEIDPTTRARIDNANSARVLRAWEVLHATGQGLARWQDRPMTPDLPREACHAVVIDAPRDWLTPRIERRFDKMVTDGALEEARQNLEHWSPALQSCRAIGAEQMIGYLKGQMTLDTAREKAVIATRQYAKRQRTWLRARMNTWHWISAEALTGS